MGSTLQARAVFVAILAAHAALFLLITFALRPRTTLSRTEFSVAPIYLADLRPEPPPRRREAERQAPSAPAIPPVLSRPAEASGPPIPAVPSRPAASGEGESQRLARVLRGSRVGCANPALLSEAEQLRCQDELEKGSQLAKYIPTPLPPERRAYYDAIVKAKAPTPNSAIVRSAGSKGVGPTAGGAGLLASEGNAVRAMGGSAPGLGCKLAFGGPKGAGGWKKPPNSLRLGPLPCFVTPPSSQWTPEAHIQNPDEVAKDRRKAEER